MNRRSASHLVVSLGALSATTVLLRAASVGNSTTIALSYLVVVLFVAAVARLWVAIVISIAAMLCFNFFFLPPVGTLTIADPQNWVALVAFLAVSIVASQLSASARTQARQALERRNELTRLFDVTRDILLTTEREGAAAAVARHVARRFELDAVTLCLPSPAGGWTLHQGGAHEPPIDNADLDRAFASASGVLEFDARTRAYGGHRTIARPGGDDVTLAPIRLGTRVVGLLAVAGRPLEPGTMDAIAGVVAIALERSQFLDQRRAAELATERAELSSALLASLSHDLRTPLTAIRTAISNIQSTRLTDEQRREQAEVALGQIERLTRLFDEILDMARIEANAVRPARDWATPADIVEAAVTHAGAALERHTIRIEATADVSVETDPRLTSAALAHLLENAAQYSSFGTPIEVRGWTEEDGVRFSVRDHGPGVDPGEIERLFEPFYRGERSRHTTQGTGMGLAITRGLVAAEGGRIWAENVAPTGAEFSMAIPARTRPVSRTE